MDYNPAEHTPLAMFAIFASFISADQMLSYKLPNSNVLAALLVMFAFALGVIAFLRHIRHP
jgi:hypothetical protein